MLSPTDATKGTFARAQAEILSPTRTLFVKESESGVEVEVSEAQPGEVVVLHGAGGAEMEGTVYYMSGGGKGPAGKSKVKFKSESYSILSGSRLISSCEVSGLWGRFLPLWRFLLFHPVSFISQIVSELTRSDEDKPVGTKSEAKAEKTDIKKSDESTKAETAKAKKERPAPIQSAWRKGPPKARDGLSAFAAPYSSQPVLVDVKGEIQPIEIIAPVQIIETSAGSESAWSKGPPLLVKTAPAPSITTDASSTEASETPPQEIEILPPTPSFAHLMPPISAWTNYSNDSDPAGAWDPAQKSPEYPTYQQYDHGYGSPQQQPMGAMYPWGIPMTPMPMSGYQSSAPHIPGGPGVLWTPNGWAVQDAAMKKVLGRVEKFSKAPGRGSKPGGVKGYYRSELSLEEEI
jgi:hypothetical protein